MEKEINIAKILMDKPKGTKLYSPMCGECHLDYIDNSMIILEELGEDNANSNPLCFYADGTYMYHGECLLFPSKEMRNWHKFAWKKGDVLVSDNGMSEVMFEKFKDNTYTSFIGKHCIYLLPNDDNYHYEEEDTYKTEMFSIETKDATQCYINTIEERLGGKLNLETLEIEDIKPKWTPKPFERVITRVDDDSVWVANIFSHMNSYGEYVTIGCEGGYTYCLPYNEETAHLIGTTDNYKEN